MNVADLHKRACEGFGQRVHEISDDQWTNPTPCPEWDVRALVQHVVSENVWTAPLMEGATVADVGDKFDGDLLGDNPQKAWDESVGAAIDAVQAPGALERTVHLSFGDFPGSEYALQLFSDYLIHTWDVAQATGGDDKLDPELVDACMKWFTAMEDAYRGAGAIGARAQIPTDADPQTKLLAMFGRTALSP